MEIVFRNGGQVKNMSRATDAAAVKCFQNDNHDPGARHLAEAVIACTFGRP